MHFVQFRFPTNAYKSAMIAKIFFVILIFQLYVVKNKHVSMNITLIAFSNALAVLLNITNFCKVTKSITNKIKVYFNINFSFILKSDQTRLRIIRFTFKEHFPIDGIADIPEFCLSTYSLHSNFCHWKSSEDRAQRKCKERRVYDIALQANEHEFLVHETSSRRNISTNFCHCFQTKFIPAVHGVHLATTETL